MKTYECIAHGGYSEKERELVKAYILEQYAGKTDKVEFLPSGDPIVSIVKITGNECISYATLGAGAYTIGNRFRKDMQNFEFVMVSSLGINQEQDHKCNIFPLCELRRGFTMQKALLPKTKR